jgi:hypothetical protein
LGILNVLDRGYIQHVQEVDRKLASEEVWDDVMNYCLNTEACIVYFFNVSKDKETVLCIKALRLCSTVSESKRGALNAIVVRMAEERRRRLVVRAPLIGG